MHYLFLHSYCCSININLLLLEVDCNGVVTDAIFLHFYPGLHFYTVFFALGLEDHIIVTVYPGFVFLQCGAPVMFRSCCIFKTLYTKQNISMKRDMSHFVNRKLFSIISWC